MVAPTKVGVPVRSYVSLLLLFLLVSFTGHPRIVTLRGTGISQAVFFKRRHSAAHGRVLHLPSSLVSSRLWDSNLMVHRGHVSKEAYSADHYSVWHISDVVYLCASNTLKLIGREEVGENVNFQSMLATLTVGEFTSPPTAAAWDHTLKYETASLGVWLDALPEGSRAAVCASPQPLQTLQLTLEYGLHRHPQNVLIIPSPPPPLSLLAWSRASKRALAANSALAPPHSLLPAPYPSEFGMCTTVLGGASSLLTAWLEYHALLGVGAFYIFVVSGSPTSLPALASGVYDSASKATRAIPRSAITVVEWPFPMWSPKEDNNAGQQMALNACAARYAPSHATLLFYDIDEFLVLPRHRLLPAWREFTLRSYGPTTSLRTRNAFGVLGANRSQVLEVMVRSNQLIHARLAFAWDESLVPPPKGKDERRFFDWLHHHHSRVYEEKKEKKKKKKKGGNATAAALGEGEVLEEGGGGDDDDDTPPLVPFLPLLGIPPSSITLEGLLEATLTRGVVEVAGREKYSVNSTALIQGRRDPLTKGLWTPTVVGIHGVYSLNNEHHQQLVMDPDVAYHLHLLNSNDTPSQMARIYFLLLGQDVFSTENNIPQTTEVTEDTQLKEGLTVGIVESVRQRKAHLLGTAGRKE